MKQQQKNNKQTNQYNPMVLCILGYAGGVPGLLHRAGEAITGGCDRAGEEIPQGQETHQGIPDQGELCGFVIDLHFIVNDKHSLLMTFTNWN